MSPGSNTESYPAFARIGLRENPGKNLNQKVSTLRLSNAHHHAFEKALLVPDTPLFSSCATNQIIIGACSPDTPLFHHVLHVGSSSLAAPIPRFLRHHVLHVGSSSGLAAPIPRFLRHVLHVGSSSGLAAPIPRFYIMCYTSDHHRGLEPRYHAFFTSCATRRIIIEACSPDTPLFTSCATRRIIIEACSPDTPLFTSCATHRIIIEACSPNTPLFSSCATRRIIIEACSPDTPLFTSCATYPAFYVMCSNDIEIHPQAVIVSDNPPSTHLQAGSNPLLISSSSSRVKKARLPALNWVVHHDNAPAHRSLLVSEFLAQYKIPVLPQPLYSPDLAPADFYSFPKIKSLLKGWRFASAEEVKIHVTKALREVTKDRLQECIEKCYGRWQKCVTAQKACFEGDVV
ncbi:hypothetical protein ANN_14930 [Periplaneta americana]|uniref:Uncharacterized protein n=1 Tax=Periplaneta americana TaxID=6978 RepID=A0ABQ8SZ19_PERAM|nr:hypothetical protein ANN_14930 [Periplaneta americana]